jgi:dTDP-L-rhamnose 4-epimerase
MCLVVGHAYDIPTVALRYFNTYGARQSLSNPYTGVAAIFASRLLNNNPPVIYEDGQQTRDFTHVSDIVQANLLVMNSEQADFQAFNVGSGEPVTIEQVADTQRVLLGSNAGLNITKQFRAGDIRHCSADISRLSALGYKPKFSFEQGMRELISWQRTQSATDHFTAASAELSNRGLL